MGGSIKKINYSFSSRKVPSPLYYVMGMKNNLIDYNGDVYSKTLKGERYNSSPNYLYWGNRSNNIV